MDTPQEIVDENSLWSPVTEKLFVDIMVEQVSRGNMKSGVFHNKIWSSILVEMNTKTARNYQMKQIKAKFHRLRMKHRAFSDLLNHTGFGWDAATNTVTADEEVWENYLKKNPIAGQFKKKRCENYVNLGILFNTGTATGVLHHASTVSPPNTDDEKELDAQFRQTGVHINVDVEDDEDHIDAGILEPKTRSGKRLAPLPTRGSKKESKMSAVSEALHAFVNVQNAKAERLKTSSCDATSAHVDDSLAVCMRILNGIQFPVEYRVKAMSMFISPEWRKMFMEMSDELREAWLMSL
ncbi:L10-interacting MYB domain-containing protein-like isoform X2 [Tripterygium wilfordii]|nr:L10-interacting MYB domain-containing protein-like isoform X2 [Tripterygium wilfordii]